MDPPSPSELEQQVLESLLAGDHPVLTRLREQLAGARVRARETTERGFFTDFWVETETLPPGVNDRFALDDVFGEVEDIEESVCFLLHVHRGRLKTLEGFVARDTWPREPRLRRLYYVQPDSDRGGQLVERSSRDLGFALRGASG